MNMQITSSHRRKDDIRRREEASKQYRKQTIPLWVMVPGLIGGIIIVASFWMMVLEAKNTGALG